MPAARRAGVRYRRGAVASLLAAAAVMAGIVFGPGALLRFEADCVTGRRETREIALADGSHVVLAPQSALVTRNSAGGREVRLLKGEALFSVRHDPSHPFRVIANGMTVTDVGTVFDVRAMDARETIVAVREGRVSVQTGISSDPSVMLGEGEEVRQHDGRVMSEQVPADEVGLWAQGQYVAHRRTVADVAQTLSQYMPGTVIVRGAGLAAKKCPACTGSRTRARHCRPWQTARARASGISRRG